MYVQYEVVYNFLSCNGVTDDNMLKFVFYFLGQGFDRMLWISQ